MTDHLFKVLGPGGSSDVGLAEVIRTILSGGIPNE